MSRNSFQSTHCLRANAFEQTECFLRWWWWITLKLSIRVIISVPWRLTLPVEDPGQPVFLTLNSRENSAPKRLLLGDFSWDVAGALCFSGRWVYLLELCDLLYFFGNRTILPGPPKLGMQTLPCATQGHPSPGLWCGWRPLELSNMTAPSGPAETLPALPSHVPSVQSSGEPRAGWHRAGTPFGRDFDAISKFSSTVTEALKQDERNPSSCTFSCGPDGTAQPGDMR